MVVVGGNAQYTVNRRVVEQAKWKVRAVVTDTKGIPEQRMEYLKS